MRVFPKLKIICSESLNVGAKTNIIIINCLVNRKLADVARNNKLDIAEFAVAMHLIQSRLKGTDIPLKLPETLAPTYLPHVNIPAVTEGEKAVYEKTFLWKNNEKTGYIDGKVVSSVPISFLLSGPAVIGSCVFCAPLNQHIGRHIDRHSTDMSTDISVHTRPICRPIRPSTVGRYVDRCVG